MHRSKDFGRTIGLGCTTLHTHLVVFFAVTSSVYTQFLVQTFQRIAMNEIGLVLSVHAMTVIGKNNLSTGG